MFQSLGPQQTLNTEGSTSTIMKPTSSIAVNVAFQQEDEITEQKSASNQNHEDINNIMAGFVNFVDYHSIQPLDIWEGRHSLPVMLFVDIFHKKLGYKLSLEEIKCLKQIAEDSQLRKDHFIQFQLWKKNLPTYYQSELFSQASPTRLFQIRKKRSFLRGDGAITSEGLLSIGSEARLRSEKSRKSRKKKTTFDQITKNFLKGVYTNQNSQDNKLQALREDMEMNALEKKWQFIVMAGEMNRWIEEAFGSEDTSTHPVFKIIDSEATFTIIFEQGQNQQIIPEVVFVKRYKAMKKKKTTKADHHKQIKKAIFGLVESNKGQTCKLSQRDKELNEALLHIMRVRNTLEHQYKILTEAAINT